MENSGTPRAGARRNTRGLARGFPLNTNAYSAEWFKKYLDPFPADRTGVQIAFLRRMIPAASHPTVLDLCAGTGRIAGPLAAAGHTVTAVERDPAAVARGRVRHPGVRFLEADVRDLSTVPG